MLFPYKALRILGAGSCVGGVVWVQIAFVKHVWGACVLSVVPSSKFVESWFQAHIRTYTSFMCFNGFTSFWSWVHTLRSRYLFVGFASITVGVRSFPTCVTQPFTKLGPKISSVSRFLKLLESLKGPAGWQNQFPPMRVMFQLNGAESGHVSNYCRENICWWFQTLKSEGKATETKENQRKT